MTQTVSTSVAGISVFLIEVSIDGKADPEGDVLGPHLTCQLTRKLSKSMQFQN